MTVVKENKGHTIHEVLQIADKLAEDLPEELKADYLKNLQYVLHAGKGACTTKHDPLSLIPPLLAGLSKGMSVTSVLKSIPIPRTTFYELTLKYPQLKLALEMGLGMSKGFWEEQQRRSLLGDNKMDFYNWYNRMQRQFGILSGYGNPADPNIVIPELKTAKDTKERMDILLDIIGSSGLGTKALANLLDSLKTLGEMDDYGRLAEQVKQLTYQQEAL